MQLATRGSALLPGLPKIQLWAGGAPRPQKLGAGVS